MTTFASIVIGPDRKHSSVIECELWSLDVTTRTWLIVGPLFQVIFLENGRRFVDDWNEPTTFQTPLDAMCYGVKQLKERYPHGRSVALSKEDGK